MIPQAKRNQLSNVSNIYQTDTKRVLCVCSAGLLWSPTLANVLHSKLGYNTRACGASQSHALIPLSDALIEWAQEIVFVNLEVAHELSEEDWYVIKDSGTDLTWLNIPDQYNWGDEELKLECWRQYEQSM